MKAEDEFAELIQELDTEFAEVDLEEYSEEIYRL